MASAPQADRTTPGPWEFDPDFGLIIAPKCATFTTGDPQWHRVPLDEESLFERHVLQALENYVAEAAGPRFAAWRSR